MVLFVLHGEYYFNYRCFYDPFIFSQIVLWFCVLAATIASLAVFQVYEETQQEVVALKAAQMNTAPTPIPLQDFKLINQRPTLNEVAFTGKFNNIFGIYDSGIRKISYALIEPAGATGPSVALLVRPRELGTLI